MGCGFPELLPALAFPTAALGPSQGLFSSADSPRKLPPTLPSYQAQLHLRDHHPFSRTQALGVTTPSHPQSSAGSHLPGFTLPWASVSPICEMTGFTIGLFSIFTQSRRWMRTFYSEGSLCLYSGLDKLSNPSICAVPALLHIWS